MLFFLDNPLINSLSSSHAFFPLVILVLIYLFIYLSIHLFSSVYSTDLKDFRRLMLLHFQLTHTTDVYYAINSIKHFGPINYAWRNDISAGLRHC